MPNQDKPYHAISVDPNTGAVDYRRLSMTEILYRCAELAACTPLDILGRQKTQSIAEARIEFYKRAHDAGYSWTEIGKFAGKDWGTCRKSVKRRTDGTLKRKASAKEESACASRPTESKDPIPNT